MSKLKIEIVQGRYGFANPNADYATNLAQTHHVVKAQGKPLVRVLLAATETEAQAFKGKEIDVVYAGNDQMTGLPMYQIAGATKAFNKVRFAGRVKTIMERNSLVLMEAAEESQKTGVSEEKLLAMYMQQAKNASEKAKATVNNPNNLVSAQPSLLGSMS